MNFRMESTLVRTLLFKNLCQCLPFSSTVKSKIPTRVIDHRFHLSTTSCTALPLDHMSRHTGFLFSSMIMLNSILPRGLWTCCCPCSTVVQLSAQTSPSVSRAALVWSLLYVVIFIMCIISPLPSHCELHNNRDLVCFVTTWIWLAHRRCSATICWMCDSYFIFTTLTSRSNYHLHFTGEETASKSFQVIYQWLHSRWQTSDLNPGHLTPEPLYWGPKS